MRFNYLFAAALLFCTNATAQLTIKAHFKSFPSTAYRIVHNQSVLNGYQGKILASGTTGADGSIDASITMSAEEPALLFIDRMFLRLWLTPSGSLQIEEADKIFTFSGTASTENTILYKTGIMQPFAPGTITTEKFEPLKQLSYSDSLENARWNIYRKVVGDKKLSENFIAYCKGEISYFSYFSKNQYPLHHVYMNKTIKLEDVPITYYSFWKEFSLLNDGVSSDMYYNSLRDYIGFIARQCTGEAIDGERSFREQFLIIDSLLAKHPYTRERQKADLILFLLKYFDYKELTAQQVEDYKISFPASVYAGFIQKEWAKKNNITFSVPSFKLKDQQGRLVSIEDFRGKIIYIDFWGSWCKPCMAQMKNSALLQEKFKNKDVVFLFINFYDTKEKWIGAVKANKIRGVHIKAEKENEKYFDEMFGVNNGFPRYALIDRKGVLITTAAPHPGDDSIVKFLEAHL